MKKILIRADASISIGSGHVMRCLTLAKYLKKRDCVVEFICRPISGNLINYIEKQGFIVNILTYEDDSDDLMLLDWEEDAQQTIDLLNDEKINCLVVDHYGIDRRWQKCLRPYTDIIFVIDDMANRPHDCDLLLDQNYYEDMALRYNALVSSECKTILGPDFSLLRPEFGILRKKTIIPKNSISRILVMFGGTDYTGEILKIIKAIDLVENSKITWDIIVGENNPIKKDLKQLCGKNSLISFHCQPKNLAQVMSYADLSIGASGSTNWERCCLGLPALIISTAENQTPIAIGCHEAGIATYMGESKNITTQNIVDHINRLLIKPEQLRSMSLNAFHMVDGKGVSRTVRTLISFLN